MKYAKAKKSVFIIDGSGYLQDPPELILPWYELITENNFDVVNVERQLLIQEGLFKKYSPNFFING